MLSDAPLKRNKPAIGLLGGIGAGKSTVAQILASRGGAIIDSDRLGHEVLGDPEVVAILRQWWGSDVFGPDGRVDRGRVGAVVFDQPKELKRLEELLYPRIGERRAVLSAKYQADPVVTVIVLDAPKLLEVGLDAECDALIFVDAEWPVRVRRVAEARDWTEEELRRREKLQKPLDMKKARADHVVVNQAGVDALRSQVERVLSQVQASFSQQCSR